MHPIRTTANKVVNEIVDSMVTSVLAELVSTYTDFDPLEIGLDNKALIRALQMENIDFHEDTKAAIANVWDEAYDNVVNGDGEYWSEEYGLYGEEVESIIGLKEDKIIKKLLSLLK